AETMLEPLAATTDPVALASVSDNVLDGYRATAPHLREKPGSEVLIVSHGGQSIALYAAQAALALGASRVDFASTDDEMLAHAKRIGANPMKTDFGKRPRRYPIVVDYGLRAEGLDFALRCTEREGICQSVSFYFTPMTMPLGKLYTLGIRFYVGRCHAAALLPEVIPLIEQGKLRPGEVTTSVVDWEEAPRAYLEPAVTLGVTRDCPSRRLSALSSSACASRRRQAGLR
ncbi:MAG: hypothetical protein ACREJT_10550, partial [Myxococcota bacterium]